MSTHESRDPDAPPPEDGQMSQDDLDVEIAALRRQAQADPQGFADLIRRLLVEDEDEGRSGAAGIASFDAGRAHGRPRTLH